ISRLNVLCAATERGSATERHERARRRPIVSDATRSGFLLASRLRGFFTCSLTVDLGSLPRNKAAAGGVSSLGRAGGAARGAAAPPCPVLQRAKGGAGSGGVAALNLPGICP